MMSDKDRGYYKFIQELCPQTLVEVCRMRKSYKDMLQQVEILSDIWNGTAYIVTKFAKTCYGIKICLQRNIGKEDNTLDASIVYIQVLFDSISAPVSTSMNIIADINKWKQDNFAEGTDSKGMKIAQYSSRNFNRSARVCIIVCYETYMVIGEGLNIMVFINNIYHKITDDYANQNNLMINNNAAIICTHQFCGQKPITDTNSCNEEDNLERSESYTTPRGHLDLKISENMDGDVHLKRTRNKKPNLYLDKLLMVLFILFTIGHVVNGAPRNDNTIMFSKDLLVSKYCNIDNFYSLNELCHTNGNDLQLVTDSCDFSDLCDEDEKPYCINTNEFGAFVCLKKNLSCKKGRYYKAFVDDKFKNKIFLLEDDCADGKYQQYESDCIHACTNEHRDLNDIPERYVVFSVGDTVNPTQVYCNFKLGFFNAHGNFLLDYDRDEFTYSFLCEHINDNNPCISTNLPLPNGTCADKCDEGFERKAPDFECTRMDIFPETKTLTLQPATEKTSFTTYMHPKTTTLPKSETPEITQRTYANGNTVDPGDKQSLEFPWWAFIFIFGVPIGFVSAILYYVKRKRDERLRQAVTYNNRTYIENQIITVQTSDSLNLPGHLGTLLQPGNNSDDQQSNGGD
ncbi:uncharacterized protein LOC132736186 isoform X2 [Ruditapes philippinarum]|uniref:uncharacterized protein LOC132736186 isoform X2 n=1 Tax=Ruditapes philippinarum TaxID=129788 RepID=UPI00295BDA2B|nr:uncharacterized protein LOC132736186 isoform X2 [Ruditapes philippinarum]